MKEKSLQKTLEDIGQRLKYLRMKKGYKSAESFAYDHDLPRVHYWRIEKGKANITINSLHKVLSIHKLSVEDFFSERYGRPGS